MCVYYEGNREGIYIYFNGKVIIFDNCNVKRYGGYI